MDANIKITIEAYGQKETWTMIGFNGPRNHHRVMGVIDQEKQDGAALMRTLDRMREKAITEEWGGKEV